MNKQSQTFHYYYYVSIRVVSFNTSGNFYGLEIWHEILWGLDFGLGIFWILFTALGITLNSEYPPPPSRVIVHNIIST